MKNTLRADLVVLLAGLAASAAAETAWDMSGVNSAFSA
jgi:hypothetical protein